VKVGSQERGKVIILVVLLVVAGVLVYQQFISGPTAPAGAPPTRTTQQPRSSAADRRVRSAADDILGERAAQKTRAVARTSNDFKPSLKKFKPGEGPDPDKADPTLRVDLLAKVQAVEYEGVERNLFQFGAAKPRLTPQQVAEAKKEAAVAAAKLAESNGSAKPGEPPKPTAPPVNMKYFGFANRPGDNRKRAFLMDGDDILVATEGEVLKKRYKVVRIGINSLVVEDIQFHSEQTLPLQESSS
jgi:hypothetical protein